MNANMLWTRRRKSRSVPPDRSSARDTVNGIDPFGTFGLSVRREPGARSDLVLARDTVALRWLRPACWPGPDQVETRVGARFEPLAIRVRRAYLAPSEQRLCNIAMYRCILARSAERSEFEARK